MAANSTTVIDIRTKADGNAAAAMDRMSKTTKAAADQEKKYQERLKGRAGLASSMVRATGGLAAMGQPLAMTAGSKVASAGSFGLPGGLGKAAGVAGGVAAGYAVLTVAASKTADALNIASNGALTAAQKQDQFTKMIPGGETWLKLRDAITGVAESLRKLNEKQKFALLAQSNAHERSMAKASGEAEISRFQNRAKAFGGAEVPDTLNKLVGGRATYEGEIAYQKAATMFPAQAAMSRAEAEAKGADRDLRGSKSRLTTLEGNRVRLADRVDKARAEEKQSVANGNAFGANAGENKVERMSAGAKAALAEQAVMNNEEKILAEINRQKELGVTLAQKESNVRKAQNNILKSQLSILGQKEQRQAGAAKSLGAMNPAQRAMAVRAVTMAKNSGDIGMLPPALRAMASQVAPGFMEKLAEQSGAKSKEYKQLQDLGVVDKGSLAETRKEAAKVQTQVEVNVNLDEEALAKKIAEMLGKAMDALLKSIDAKAKTRGDQLRTGMQVSNAAK